MMMATPALEKRMKLPRSTRNSMVGTYRFEKRWFCVRRSFTTQSLPDSGKHVVEDDICDPSLFHERVSIKPCRDDDHEVVCGSDVNALAA